MTKAKRLTIAFLFWAMGLGMVLYIPISEDRRILEKAFGGFGMDAYVLYVLIIIPISLPFIYFSYHAIYVMHGLKEMGHSGYAAEGMLGKFTMLKKGQPQYRRSLFIYGLGFVYFFVVSAAWITYAAIIGV